MAAKKKTARPSNLLDPRIAKLASKIVKESADTFVVTFEIPQTKIGHKEEELVVTFTRRLHNWKPTLDVDVNGIAFQRNCTIEDPAELEATIELWMALNDVAFEMLDAEHDAKREKNLELLGRLL